MRRKNLKKKLMTAGIVAAGLLIIVLSVVLFLGKRKLDDTQAELDARVMEITSNQQLVYVAARDITKGEKLTEENAMQQKIYTGLPNSSYMQTDQLGQTATVDIAANEPVMANMITEVEITTDLRWYEVAVAYLMATQKNYDVVDVRILFPNGEDYLVLTKKTITDLLMDSNIFTVQANEDEILRMASAIIDAYTTSGTRIYTTKYIESNIQEEAIPNYPVNPDVIDLINSDPNILDQAIKTLNLKARNDLDKRLSSLSDDHLQAVSQGFGIQDTASQSVIRDEEGNVLLEPDDVTVNEASSSANTESSDDFYSEDTTKEAEYDYGQGTTYDQLGTDNNG